MWGAGSVPRGRIIGNDKYSRNNHTIFENIVKHTLSYHITMGHQIPPIMFSELSSFISLPRKNLDVESCMHN